jgi:hypothetical protein
MGLIFYILWRKFGVNLKKLQDTVLSDLYTTKIKARLQYHTVLQRYFSDFQFFIRHNISTNCSNYC